MVADMTDFFLVLMLPGAGDELQGLKKGVVEIADMIAINKADGDNIRRAKAAAADYRAALHILTPRSPHWSPPVVTYSALDRRWRRRPVDRRARPSRAHDQGRRVRRASARAAGQMDVGDARRSRLRAPAIRPVTQSQASRLEAAVAEGRTSPAVAVDEIAASVGHLAR